MVQSQLNPSINFPEIRYVDKVDIGFKAPIYSLNLYKSVTYTNLLTIDVNLS